MAPPQPIQHLTKNLSILLQKMCPAVRKRFRNLAHLALTDRGAALPDARGLFIFIFNE